jgi:hypothetical protein
LVTLTEEGKIISAKWAAEAAPLISLYSMDKSTKVIKNQVFRPQEKQDQSPAMRHITCGVCGERISAEDAREMYEGSHPGTVKCACGKSLTREYLQALPSWEESTED